MLYAIFFRDRMWCYDFNIIITLPIHHTGGIYVLFSAIERSKYLVSTSIQL